MESRPSRLVLWGFVLLTNIFGVTFVTKLVELGERRAEAAYRSRSHGLRSMYADEIESEAEKSGAQEKALIGMIDEKRLEYLDSIVLGLNDALVELTGALAGLTFAFQDSRLIALTGLITGIAASFSMAASEYLSHETEESADAVTAGLYTGAAYVLTVLLLITPFLLLSSPYVSLGITLALVIGIIFVFSFYVSVTKEFDFKERFLKMASISVGVAGLSFAVGVLVKTVFGVDV